MPRRSVLALAVLSMLTEEPMHAYRMQQLIKERHKDDVVNVSQRNSVYQTIQRLLREELVAVAGTERAENRPERTTYRITDAGRTTLQVWLRDMLAVPTEEFPDFPAALSFLPNLSQAEAVAALTERMLSLEDKIRSVKLEMEESGAWLAPVFLVETVYQVRVLETELSYVRELVGQLGDGTVAWEPA
jgi:DNA-binding PadR family transcriptional regulator